MLGAPRHLPARTFLCFHLLLLLQFVFLQNLAFNLPRTGLPLVLRQQREGTIRTFLLLRAALLALSLFFPRWVGCASHSSLRALVGIHLRNASQGFGHVAPCLPSTQRRATQEATSCQTTTTYGAPAPKPGWPPWRGKGDGSIPLAMPRSQCPPWSWGYRFLQRFLFLPFSGRMKDHTKPSQTLLLPEETPQNPLFCRHPTVRH